MFDNLRSVFSRFSDSVKQLQETEIQEKHLEEPLEELEMHLLQHNVAVSVTEQIIEQLQSQLIGKAVDRSHIDAEVHNAIYGTILQQLEKADCDTDAYFQNWLQNTPALLLFVGANGAGKTTAIAKIATYLETNRIVLAAGDTFRDASIEQLQQHAQQLDMKCINQGYGSDAAAVIYDAQQHATKYRLDMVLADTAGRAHTNVNLMEELQKICRVNEPDGIILVVDATIGNDVIEQIEQYRPLGIHGIIITKTDADTRGGTILTVAAEAEIPILFLGTGQSYTELNEFDPATIAEQIVPENKNN